VEDRFMGSITERTRADGTSSYRAEIVLSIEGKRRKFYQTFSKRIIAQRWMKKKETELRKSGGVEREDAKTQTLALAIDLYVQSNQQIGRTKAQVLQSIKEFPIGSMAADKIDASHIIAFAQSLLDGDRKPQTVLNYISHLSAVFQIAKYAWHIPLDPEEMKIAMSTAKRLNLVRKSSKRDRRPSIDEMNRLMEFFEDRSRRTKAQPMHIIIAFAMFSTRRQDEICRITHENYEPHHHRILVRDMKNPGEKIGNHIWCDLPDTACKIIDSQGDSGIIFPYKRTSISASFTRACKVLDIEDLRFHDLRHEGVSRLFEMGFTIPQVASYSGHRSWPSLQRYAHIRSTGDKWDQWEWIDRITKTSIDIQI
jgi:integrase